MSDTPKFEVIDRRKYRHEAEEPDASASQPAPAPESKPERPELEQLAPAEESRPGPRRGTETPRSSTAAAGDVLDTELEPEGGLPPAPTAEESRQQKIAYDASAQRLEDLIRAQNPGMGPQPAVTFDHLVNQLYVSAMIQMGAGQEGQRARIDIIGARQTIDLLGILAEKTQGNLNEAEERVMESVLYETRMAFLELTNMISMQSVPPPPVPPGQR